MLWRNTANQYGLIAQFLHWMIVVLVVYQFVLASAFEDLPVSMARLQLLGTHKALGMTVLMLTVVRLSWRLLNDTPEIPASRTRLLAQITHYAFYLLLLAVPLSGWLLSSASNLSVSYFRLFVFPDLVSSNEELAQLLKVVHETLNFTLAAVALLHLTAALWHQFRLHDGVLGRMLPGPRLWGKRTTQGEGNE
jgi:cytochrome b561